jgi:hypothetical protein
MEMLMFGGDVERYSTRRGEGTLDHFNGGSERTNRWRGVHGEAAASGTTVDFYSCFVPVVSFNFLLFE